MISARYRKPHVHPKTISFAPPKASRKRSQRYAARVAPGHLPHEFNHQFVQNSKVSERDAPWDRVGVPKSATSKWA